MHRFTLAATLITLAATCATAWACGTHGTGAGSGDWTATSSAGGLIQGQLLLESTLVPPTASTTCTAGIGLGTLSNPAPAGLNVTAMAIVIVNTSDGSRTPLPAFSFAPSGTTSAGLTAGSGSSTVPNTNPLAGGTWFGFSSLVDPFVLPSLGPDEFTAFQFDLELPAALAPLLTETQYAGGEGATDGTPTFTGDHPVQYFAAADPQVLLTAPVPEPSSLLLMGLGAAVFAWRRSDRRR